MPTHRPVLVIEDHDDTRRMVEELLTFAGFPACSASNGQEGLVALREHHPCLILLDLSMPIMDGWRFREAQLSLREDDLATVPVVVMSALSRSEQEAERIAAIECLEKPIDIDRMLAVVGQYCESVA